MRLESCTGLSGLRTDRELKSFQDVMSFYLDAGGRVKGTGKKVVASGPVSPLEMIYAAGALPYDVVTRENLLQSMLEERCDLVQQATLAGMSPEFSPWNLVMLGSALGGKSLLAVDAFSTAVGGFPDQLTKSFQIMAQAAARPLRFWEVPPFEPDAEKWALPYLEKELAQLCEWLEIQTGNRVTAERLAGAIRQSNVIRKDMMELDALMALPRSPMAALEYYMLHMLLGDFCQDPEALHSMFGDLLGELRARLDSGYSVPGIPSSPIRIYVMGDETQELSFFNAIEDYGGCLVGCDFRLPAYYDFIDEKTEAFTAFAGWVWRMPNNMTAAARVMAELPAIKKQKPDAVILSGVVGARLVPGAERLVRDTVRNELGVPALSIETTLPHENTEKVDYQIRAFLETMR